ncbi:regulator of chromosome condensation (RCC1) repeat-containing protein [Besnoitia besnoiti]|uniref:Regulator of chromosome condensation (RCC1) repeat-containing protein n=1 Tax=Besnoitia besnoiti TaxID=94643 RepID=A0A2A9MPT4_BESBE|nr:regulator of chromosome condensation (RCC1) repeat-containing protein [Besnoitia besnoiti]PFH38113.1 regulator of chromosome condensation (RCC1) repeat-containing protein [Besnoitia besnoiti]
MALPSTAGRFRRLAAQAASVRGCRPLCVQAAFTGSASNEFLRLSASAALRTARRQSSGFSVAASASRRPATGTDPGRASRVDWESSTKGFASGALPLAVGAAVGAAVFAGVAASRRREGESREGVAWSMLRREHLRPSAGAPRPARALYTDFDLPKTTGLVGPLSAAAACASARRGASAKAAPSADRRRVLCSWGSGVDGQLGLGGSVLSVSTPQPVPVSALHAGESMSQCAAGAFHSVCCTSLGRVFTWGRGGKNRLGHDWPREARPSADGDRSSGSHAARVSASGVAELAVQALPKCVEGLRRLPVRVVAVACGDDHTLALTDSGEVYSWGGNAHGECGRVEARDAGDADGQQADKRRRNWLWGVLRGDKGEGNVDTARDLDDARESDADSPWARRQQKERGLIGGRVEGELRGKRVTQIACGKHVSAAVTQDGELYVWGEGRGGQVGPPPAWSQARGGRRGTDFASIASSSDLAFNAATPRKLEVRGPVESEADSADRLAKRVVQVACGSSHCAAVTADGEIYTWGSDDYGQLGLGKESRYVLLPRRVDALADKQVASVHCGHFFTCCTTTAGEVFVWGYGRDGECGNARSDADLPAAIAALSPRATVGASAGGGKVVGASAGGGHLAAWTSEGGLWMWGRGREGQLGRGDAIESVAVSRDVPQLVEQLWGSAADPGAAARPLEKASRTRANEGAEGRQKSKVVAAWCGQTHTLALVEPTGDAETPS